MTQVMEKTQVEKIIHDIIQNSQMAMLATVSDNKPWVRYMAIHTMEGSMSLYSSTHLASRKVTHIKANPNVHLTMGCRSMEEMGPYLQYAATCIIHTDKEMKHKHWHKMLEQHFSGPDDPNYCVLEYKPHTIEVWGATADMFTPLIWESSK